MRTGVMNRTASLSRRALLGLAGACLLGLLAALGACSTEQDDTVPDFTPSGSSSAVTSEPSDTGTSGAPDASEPAPAQGVTLGEAAVTPEQQPVVDASVAYWQVLFTAAAGPELDLETVGTVARDEARARIERYVTELQGAGRSLGGGGMVIGVAAVQADGPLDAEGTTATVTGCAQDASYEVDAQGQQTELPDGPAGLRGTLLRQGPAWIVTDVQNDDNLCG